MWTQLEKDLMPQKTRNIIERLYVDQVPIQTFWKVPQTKLKPQTYLRLVHQDCVVIIHQENWQIVNILFN